MEVLALDRPSERTPTYRVTATPGGWTFAISTVLILAGVLPILYTRATVSDLGRGPVALAVAILLYSSIRIGRLLVTGREALLEATFWVYVYIFYGLAALAQTASDTYALPPYTLYPDDVGVRAFIVIILGLLAYECGRLVGRSRSSAADATEGRSIVPRRVCILGALALGITLWFVLNEGMAHQFSSRQRAEFSYLGTPSAGLRVDQIQDKAIGLIKIFLRWVPAFVSLYLMLHLWRAARDNAKVPRWVAAPPGRLLLVLLIGANLVVNNPVSNPRSRFGGVAMALALAIVPLATPLRFRAAVAGLLAAFLFVFPVADAFRYDERDFTVAPLAQDLVTSADFSMFQQELNAQLYVTENGHTLGRQAMGAIFVFVPRRWWPDKPIATGDLISRTNLINASDSLWAEAYVDGGYLAVFVFFLIYGRLSFMAERAYMRRRRGSLSAAAVLVPLFAAFQILILRGALQPVVGEIAPVALLALACYAGRRRSGRHSSGAAPEMALSPSEQR